MKAVKPYAAMPCQKSQVCYNYHSTRYAFLLFPPTYCLQLKSWLQISHGASFCPVCNTKYKSRTTAYHYQHPEKDESGSKPVLAGLAKHLPIMRGCDLEGTPVGILGSPDNRTDLHSCRLFWRLLAKTTRAISPWHY